MVVKLNKEMSELLLKEVEDIEPLIVGRREVDDTVELDVSYFYTLFLGGDLIYPIEAQGYASYFYALPYGSKLDNYRARGSTGYIPHR